MRLQWGRAISEWLDGHSIEAGAALYAALFAIVDGTWTLLYRYWEEPRLHATLMEFAPGQVMIWRTYPRDPDSFHVVYVGERPL